MTQNLVKALIRYFLELSPGAGRTDVVKFLYLSDVEARKYLGKPISHLNYILYDYGPFDSDIYFHLDDMEAAGAINCERYSYKNTTCYRYSVTKLDTDRPFRKEEMLILDSIADAVRRTPLKDLLSDIVYQTEPMLDAKARELPSGSRLRMDLVNNKGRIPGLELEKMLGAISDLDEGKGVPLEKFLEELAIKA
jgi:hypothetical protein